MTGGVDHKTGYLNTAEMSDGVVILSRKHYEALKRAIAKRDAEAVRFSVEIDLLREMLGNEKALTLQLSAALGASQALRKPLEDALLNQGFVAGLLAAHSGDLDAEISRLQTEVAATRERIDFALREVRGLAAPQ